MRLSALLPLAIACLPAGGAEFDFGSQTLTVPNGFVVERVAGPGLVDRPIVADFDEHGRLYVAESSGSNDPVKKQLEEKPHRILRLEDTDADGIFDRAVTFADKMMFPEGVMWYRGSLYVSAPPVIWKLTDTNGDGVADSREEWLDAKTLTGCANDLHGPYRGPDGWIYWCKGAFAQQTYERPGANDFVTRAAHIFRRRPDGGPVEAVMTGGMDNPVDVVFTPEGERIFTTTFFQHPGGGQRDGLIHAIYGGVYGKVHDVIEDHKKTGDLLPVLTHMGPAAPAGLARYESSAFGPDYRDNLFAALFNLHKVTRHILHPDGGTYRTDDSDFLVSDSTDFHPTDVIEDADGSLLVIDTGGWYKLCCPTSQLWKPDVLGAIYRVRHLGTQKVKDARGANIKWSELNSRDLAGLLGDSRPAVVRRATEQLQEKEDTSPVAEVLEAGESLHAKLNAVWALTGAKDPSSRQPVRQALSDSNASVRHAAIHSVSVNRDRKALGRLVPLLSDNNLQVRRAAAEAIGRTGDASAVNALLAAAGNLQPSENGLPDRVLEHSIIFALIEINAAEQTKYGLDSAKPFVKRAALIALDQMDDSTLQPLTVAALLSSDEPVLKQTASWILSHRPDWGAELATFFEAQLRSTRSGSGESEMFGHLARLAGAHPIQELLSATAVSAQIPERRRAGAIDAMREARLKQTPQVWVEALAQVLRHSEHDQLRASAVQAAAGFSFKEMPAQLREPLLAVATDADLAPEVRLQAIQAATQGMVLRADLFDFVLQQFGTRTSPQIRGSATAILAKAKLAEEHLLAVSQVIKRATPLELPGLVGLFEKSSSQEVGRALLSNLRQADGIAGLHSDALRQVLEKYPEALKNEAAPLLAQLNEDADTQAARLNELLPKLERGDVRRGQAIFNSTRAACSACHAIGYLGGDLGPDLTRIGQVRTERDLLEALIFPSASFVRSYEPVLVSTGDGEEFSGILRRDAPDELVLATGPGVQIRLARSDVQEVRPGKVSVMPQGLDEQLSLEELADLLAFLKAAQR